MHIDKNVEYKIKQQSFFFFLNAYKIIQNHQKMSLVLPIQSNPIKHTIFLSKIRNESFSSFFFLFLLLSHLLPNKISTYENNLINRKKKFCFFHDTEVFLVSFNYVITSPYLLNMCHGLRIIFSFFFHF